MFVRAIVRTLGAAAIVCVALINGAVAQQQPSAAAVALAKQILELKGGIHMFDTVVDGVIRHHKTNFLQINPNLAKDLDAVETKLRAEYAPRRADVQTEVARGYASQFTEQELKDALAFYKTPLGKKLIDGEPKAIDEATKRVDAWASKYAGEVATKMRAEMKKKGHTEF